MCTRYQLHVRLKHTIIFTLAEMEIEKIDGFFCGMRLEKESHLFHLRIYINSFTSFICNFKSIRFRIVEIVKMSTLEAEFVFNVLLTEDECEEIHKLITLIQIETIRDILTSLLLYGKQIVHVLFACISRLEVAQIRIFKIFLFLPIGAGCVPCIDSFLVMNSSN